jgi:hypothetical protein
MFRPAKMLGTDLKQLEGVANGLLDIESSIGAEFEAEVMTGKQLNLEKARYAALMGDLGTLADELNKQEITALSFGKMNVLQKEALAKSFNMSKDEMAEMLMNEEELKKVGKGTMEEAKKKYDLLEKTVGREKAIKQLGSEQLANQFASSNAQERFAASMAKLQDIFVMIAEPLMPILDIFGEIFTILGPIVKIISTVLKPALDTIGFVISGILEGITSLFSIIGGGEADFTTTKKYLHKIEVPGTPQTASPSPKSINDGVVNNDGGLMVSGPKGSISLDKEDTFVGNKNGITAGTNLFQNQSNDGNITMLSNSLGNKMDIMIGKLDNVVNAINKGMTVNLDGDKVSRNLLTPLAISNRNI